MKAVIGFANQFFTMWEIGDAYEEPVYYGTMHVGSVTKQSVIFVQNLATDLERAKAKAAQLYNSFTPDSVDMELRGHSSFTQTLSSNIRNRDEYYPMDCFSFGKYEGVAFAECDDLWQLNRAMNNEAKGRRKANARRRLIELGAIVRHDGKWLQSDNVEIYDLRKLTDSLVRGHHFSNGDKVTLELIQVGEGSFSGQYGTTYLRTYASKCGKMFKYMGSSPIEVPTTSYQAVKATIKHDYYNTDAETKLLRMKIA